MARKARPSRPARPDRFPQRAGGAGAEPPTRTSINDTGGPIVVGPTSAEAIVQRERARAAVQVRMRGQRQRERQVGEGNAVEARLRHFTF